jgi:copper transport protein
MLCVVWLVAGGTVQAVVQIGSVGALWDTDYGRLLLGKVVLMAAVLGAAAYARRLVLRPQATASAPARLRRTVGAEVTVSALVLALSAVLVQTTPSRQDTGDRPADAPAGVSQTLTSPLYTLQYNVFPVQIGENNTVHAFVYTPEGAPLPVQEWFVTAKLTGQDLEPVTTRMLGVLPHHAIGALTFALPGVYELKFTARTTDIDQATVTTTVTVR